MGKIINNFHCKVCGWHLPYNLDEDELTDGSVICDSCGCGIGYNDWRLQDAKEHRQKWIDNGKKWWGMDSYKPQNWNPDEQMKNIPAEWL